MIEPDYEKPKYGLLVALLESCATEGRLGPSYPSGYGIDIGDIDIAWLYEQLERLGASLDVAPHPQERAR